MGDESGYSVRLKDVDPQPTAVVYRRAALHELAGLIPQAIGEVWNHHRRHPLPKPRRNVVLYLDDAGHLECGVEVDYAFPSGQRVTCSTLPGGRVATAAHFGGYEKLPAAHAAIRQWCADQGHQLAGPHWEIYDHWDPDPTQRRTDVYYLLKP